MEESKGLPSSWSCCPCVPDIKLGSVIGRRHDITTTIWTTTTDSAGHALGREESGM